MNQQEAEQQLEDEGFSPIYLHRDEPHVLYANHTHAKSTTYIILEGEMILTVEGETRVVKTGDRFDVPAGAAHSVRMGPKGCKYLIGEK